MAITITELCDILDVELAIRYYPNQSTRWSASFNRGEIMGRGCLVSAYENGKTPDEAIANYVRCIRGTRMCFNAGTDARKEFTIPVNLEA